jgi:hypothetical protein
MSTIGRPGFRRVWGGVHAAGEVHLVSSRETSYTVTAEMSKGRLVLIARPPPGILYVHQDRFGQSLNCSGTRTGGIYNGSPSIWDWYADRS